MSLPQSSKPETSVTKEPEKAPAFSFNIKACQEHLNKIVDEMNKFVGKKNRNPFLWIKNNVTPLVNRIKGGDKSKELQDQVLALKSVDPIVDPDYVEPPKDTSPVPRLPHVQ